MSVAPPRRVNGIRGHVVGRDLDLAPVVLAGAGAALGATFVVVAWAVHPLLVPGVLALAVLVAATLREPAVGVAAGFLLVAALEPRGARATTVGADHRLGRVPVGRCSDSGAGGRNDRCRRSRLAIAVG